jgi:predicted regulator of Ras-like GTPase activity (Roadblock/LC7/MglB family)
MLKNLAQREAQSLLHEVSGVKAVVIASVDGFDIASATASNVDPARIAAMASSISAIGAVVAQEATLGTANSVVINSEQGFVQVFSVNRRDVPLIVNVVADATGVLAQVAYRGRALAQTLLQA